MAKDIQQVQTLFSRSAYIYIIIAMCMYWIGILLLSSNQNLGTNQLISYTIQKYSYPGLIGLTLDGIIAMVMSTADSYINSSSVLISNDIFSQLNLKFVKGNEILIARISAVIIGIVAIAPAIFFQGLLDLIIFTFSFYMPIVTPAFILGVLGFRSSGKSVIIGMCAGFITVLVISLSFESVNSIAPSLVVNVIFLLGSHYILKQPGGWVGIKDNSYLEEQKLIRRRRWNKFVDNIYNFNFITYCKSHIPKQDSVYIYFAGFCMIVTYTKMFLTPSFNLLEGQIVTFSYISALLISISFIIVTTFGSEVKKKSFLRYCGC